MLKVLQPWTCVHVDKQTWFLQSWKLNIDQLCLLESFPFRYIQGDGHSMFQFKEVHARVRDVQGPWTEGSLNPPKFY